MVIYEYFWIIVGYPRAYVLSWIILHVPNVFDVIIATFRSFVVNFYLCNTQTILILMKIFAYVYNRFVFICFIVIFESICRDDNKSI